MGNDIVDHPSYYNRGKIEVIDFIEDQNLPFHLANVVKYICRAGHKEEELTDLSKAAWYLDRYINLVTDNITKDILNKEGADERSEVRE